METRFTLPHLHLQVSPSSADFFSTLLQSGIEMVKCSGETIGTLLARLPGFTPQYITERVQTIFINGIANDDLKTSLCEASTLAISTAMPGLAGAIFRRNSLHATLRTIPEQAQNQSPKTQNRMITVKIYGAITKEKGSEILAQGAVLPSRNLSAFLSYRPSLIPRILYCTLNEKEIARDKIWERIRHSNRIRLSVTT